MLTPMILLEPPGSALFVLLDFTQTMQVSNAWAVLVHAHHAVLPAFVLLATQDSISQAVQALAKIAYLVVLLALPGSPATSANSAIFPTLPRQAALRAVLLTVPSAHRLLTVRAACFCTLWRPRTELLIATTSVQISS